LVHYAYKWGSNTEHREHEIYTTGEYEVHPLFKPHLSVDYHRYNQTAQASAPINTFNLLGGITSYPIKNVRFNISGGISDQGYDDNSSNYRMFALSTSADFPEIFSFSALFSRRYQQSDVKEHIDWEGKTTLLAGLTLQGNYFRERTLRKSDGAVLGYSRRDFANIAYRPPSFQLVNLFTCDRGEKNYASTSHPETSERKENRITSGLTLYPVKWFNAGLSLTVKDLTESDTELLTTLATLRTTFSLPYNFELTGFARGAEQKDEFMDGYSAELGYNFMNTLKLSMGYNYARSGNVFQVDQDKSGWYARVNAFRLVLNQ